MNRKIGKFKLWQLLAAGGVIGIIVYEKSKGKAASGVAEGLVASTNNPLSGGGGGEGPGLGGTGGGVPPVIPGPPGEVGAPGTPGARGAPGIEQLTPRQVATLESLAESRNNGVPSASLKPAPVSKSRFNQTNPVTKQKYYTTKEHGKTVHVYKDGHKVTVGAKSKPAHHANPLHRPSHAAPVAPHNHARPAPLNHTVAAKGAPSRPTPKAAPRPAPKPKFKARRW